MEKKIKKNKGMDKIKLYYRHIWTLLFFRIKKFQMSTKILIKKVIISKKYIIMLSLFFQFYKLQKDCHCLEMAWLLQVYNTSVWRPILLITLFTVYLSILWEFHSGKFIQCILITSANAPFLAFPGLSPSYLPFLPNFMSLRKITHWIQSMMSWMSMNGGLSTGVWVTS